MPISAARHRPLGDIYVSDHADARQSGRFRWLLSTCLAAAVGVLAILVVIAGSTDTRETDGGLLSEPAAASARRRSPSFRLPSARVDGLRWAIPKTDRLLIPSGAMATKFVILDPVRQRRGSRDYIMNKPYARLVARLAPIYQGGGPEACRRSIRSSSTPTPRRSTPPSGRRTASRMPASRSSSCWAASIPSEDGQELSAEEVAEAVIRAQAATAEPPCCGPASPPSARAPAAGDVLAEGSARTATELPPSRTPRCSPSRNSRPRRRVDDLEGREVRVVKAQRGDTLARILQRMGAETWQARAMSDAARSALPDGALQARPGGARDAGALGGARQPHGADPLQRVRRSPGPQGDRDAQRRRRVRRQRLADRRAHRLAPSFSTTTSRRPRASTPACTTRPSARASRPTSSCRSSRSTPTRRTSASACAPATASSSSST